LWQAPRHSNASWRSWIRDNDEEINSLRRRLTEEGESSESHSSDKSNADQSELISEDESEAESLKDVSLSSSESESDIRDRDKKISRFSHNAYLPGERQALAKFIADMTLAEWTHVQKNIAWRKFQKMVGIFQARNYAF
jgi:G3E family GTPase